MFWVLFTVALILLARPRREATAVALFWLTVILIIALVVVASFEM
jgi:hypothetical protein